MNAINSNEQMIQKINEVLQNKKDAIVNIVNDKLTISVFSLLEKNLQNVKEINFVIRDVKFLPHQSEMAHEFEINPTDILFNAYDITEKNKLQHFSKARSMHDFIEKHVNIRKVNAGIHIGGNILIIDDDFMIQGSSSLEVSKKSSRDAFSNINFDTILNGSADKEQILGALETFKKIWFNEQISVDYKDELLASLQYVYKEHAPEFLYYFTLNELFGNQLDAGVERFERDSVRFKKTEIWNALYDFQKDCVVSAIRKLNTYGGCIIADSVGLGKTFEALAIIKYFEIGMNRVLVLTPARQQHIHTEKQDYFIDLVFYNYILKCFVLIDLKTERITHQDVGQMDMYIRMYDELKKSPDDNPTLGIVLCSETDEDIARYSILHGNEQLFASKYKLYLPTEDELREEIETQKAIFYLQQKETEDATGGESDV